MTLAPDPTMLRVVRLAASSLAADLGFSVHDVDDLALAVDELAAALFDVADTDVNLFFRVDQLGLSVRGHALAGADIELTETATSILTQACDLFETGGHATGPSFSLVKVRAGID